jgi:hypothetical protein
MDVSWAHAEAIQGLLDALPYTVYLGEVTDSDDDITYPYLVVWPPPATSGRENLTGNLLRATTRTQISVIGQDVHETLAALDRAGQLLNSKRPVVAGRVCTQLELTATSGPPEPNSTVRTTPGGKPTHRAFAIYSLTSLPAPA